MATAAEAVTAQVAAHRGAAELFSWGVNKSWAEGGDDPCEDIWVHDCNEETPHWHYVTSGLSDPSKVEGSPDTARSGLGYELSFRLKREEGETEAPEWPWKRLQELGWGIFKANLRLDVGHYIRRRSVITGGKPPTELQGYYLIADPRLPPTTSDSGSIAFFQVVGITDEELLRCECGEPDEMAAELRARSPLGITDLERTGPERDEVDLVEHNRLQNLLAERCLETLPEGKTRIGFAVSADAEEQDFSFEMADEEFRLNRRAEATLKLLFALHWSAGSYVNRMQVTLGQKPGGEWSIALDFEYDE